MSMKLTTQLVRSKLSACALMLGLSAAPASYAEQITFRFEGYVTSFSNSVALGGMALDESITGTLTYDTSTVPDKTWGSWASTYTLQGGATRLTFMLSNGRLYEDTTLNARLVNGPVFPYASDDTFAINPVNLDASMYVRTGETQSLSLNFQNTSGVNGLSSANLPSYIDIARLPFSGGTLYAFSGPAPTGEDVYVINRVLEAYQDSPYANGYGTGLGNQVTRYSRSNPNQPGYSFSLEESQAGDQTKFRPGRRLMVRTASPGSRQMVRLRTHSTGCVAPCDGVTVRAARPNRSGCSDMDKGLVRRRQRRQDGCNTIGAQVRHHERGAAIGPACGDDGRCTLAKRPGGVIGTPGLYQVTSCPHAFDGLAPRTVAGWLEAGNLDG